MSKPANVYACLAASNHTDKKREKDDYYATDPKALELLLQKETFSHTVWEPCVGGGHLAKVLAEHGHEVIASDIVDRGYPGTEILDFINPSIEQTDLLKSILASFDGDIITNPPYSILNEFLVKALSILKPGRKLAILGRIQVIESQSRRVIYEKYPIKTIYVSSKRIICSPGGTFKETSSAVCYAWFIWEKGYDGPTTMKWLD